jgi:hypothetical protein
MSLQNLDKAKLKLILKTSESFPTQYAPSRASIVDGQLSPSRSGHPLGSHLRGVQQTVRKTKFCSLDDMADALDLVLRTPAGAAALAQLQPGVRSPLNNVQINQIYDVEGEIDSHPRQKVKFTRGDLARAGFTSIRCTAVLEGRARGTELYLHVQTFFPAFHEGEITRLLDAKTRP